jgi:hypothetical protein
MASTKHVHVDPHVRFEKTALVKLAFSGCLYSNEDNGFQIFTEPLFRDDFS